MKNQLIKLGLAALLLTTFAAPTVQAGQCINNLVMTPANLNCDGLVPYFINIPPGTSFSTNSTGDTVLPYFYPGGGGTNWACVGTNGGNVQITFYGSTNCCGQTQPRLAGTLGWYNFEQNYQFSNQCPMWIPANAYAVTYELYYVGDHCTTEGIGVRLCAVATCNLGGGD